MEEFVTGEPISITTNIGVLTMLQTSITSRVPFKKIQKNPTINALLAACIGMISAESHALTLYGKMVGTITGYEDVAGTDFNTQFTGSSASPIGMTIEYNFYVSDWFEDYYAPYIVPVVNTSSDPLHYGTYTSSQTHSQLPGHLSSGFINLGGKNVAASSHTVKQTLVNDVGPGDKFTWNTRYYDCCTGAIAGALSIDFSLSTLQNILSSGYTAQEFYWLRSNDPSGTAAGVFSVDSGSPPATYTFNINRLSLTASENPTPPEPIPLPGSAWLLGTALAGLLTARKARR